MKLLLTIAILVAIAFTASLHFAQAAPPPIPTPTDCRIQRCQGIDGRLPTVVATPILAPQQTQMQSQTTNVTITQSGRPPEQRALAPVATAFVPPEPMVFSSELGLITRSAYEAFVLAREAAKRAQPTLPMVQQRTSDIVTSSQAGTMLRIQPPMTGDGGLR